MKILDISQEGPGWAAWRKEGLGGSDAGHVMGGFPWTSRAALWAQKRGGEVVEENEAMARGKRLEPEARLLYQQLTGLRCRPVCVQHDAYPYLRASLDGLSEDGRVVLEIKCPTKEGKHRDALGGKYPDYYKAQLQHNLLVTGAPLLHFVSYHPDFVSEDRLALIPVEPDGAYQEELLERERNEWEKLQEAA
jgi:putative phage-type endonuclease